MKVLYDLYLVPAAQEFPSAAAAACTEAITRLIASRLNRE